MSRLKNEINIWFDDFDTHSWCILIKRSYAKGKTEPESIFRNGYITRQDALKSMYDEFEKMEDISL